eukprot:4467989-Amphidinium_carterae.1
MQHSCKRFVSIVAGTVGKVGCARKHSCGLRIHAGGSLVESVRRCAHASSKGGKPDMLLR